MQQSGQTPLTMPTSEVIAGMTESCNSCLQQISDKAASHAPDRFEAGGFHAPLVGARNRGRRAIHVRRRCLHRQRRDPDHCRRAARKLGPDRGGDCDLSDRLCHAGGHRRPSRRYPRHQDDIHRRRRRFHRHLAVVRAGAIRTRTDSRAAGARRHRGADGAAGARHHPFAVYRRRAWPRLRHLRHRARPRRCSRLHARRHFGDARSRRIGLARGVFRQRAIRPDHHRRRHEHHADGAASRRHAARYSKRHRAVCGIAVPDRAAAVRPRSELVAMGLAGDGGGRRDHRRLPAAGAIGRAACR